VPAAALKVADVAPAATMSEAGTLSRALLLDSWIEVPPEGAAGVKATVQVLEAPGPRLAGVQASEESVRGITRLTGVVCEMLFSVAVMIAL
jgi:hypothetical protein